MTDPASLVYSSSTPGLATTLTSGLGPLSVLMREEHARRVAAAREAKVKAAAEKSQTIPKLNMKGSEWFQPLANARALAFYPDSLKDYRNPDISQLEKKFLVAARAAEDDGMTAQELAVGNAFTKAIEEAEKNGLIKQKVAEGIDRLRLNDDGSLKPASDIDLKQLAAFNTNADYIDSQQVVKDFLDDLAQRQESEYATAARPGQAGMVNSVSSNLFANDGRGKVIRVMDGRGNVIPKIANIPALDQAALQNSKMTALLRRNLENGQKPTASLLMGLGAEHVTDDQLEALNAQTDTGTSRSQKTMEELLRPYATLVEKQRELSPLAVRLPRSTAANKVTPNDATATPTGGFGLSVGDNAQPWTETTANPKKGGLLNFLTPKIVKPGTRSVSFNNHYPHVGVAFASEKAAGVPLLVDTKDMRVLGTDGTPTRHNNNQVNTKGKMTATDRSFVLEINGKRVGLPKAGSSADAYQELGRLIDQLTPEQAHKAALVAYYQGTVSDKATVSGDGTGGRAKIIGYKDSNGRMLSADELAAGRRWHELTTPVYDRGESQSSVMVPATATLDAQAARQTPGYNPRQRTAQEAELIRQLEAKGGRVVDPYHTTPTPPTPAPVRPSFIPTKTSAASHQKLRIGVADPLGFGAEANGRKPTRTENGIKMTGGSKSLDIDWSQRGGSVHKTPKTSTGGLS